MRVSLSLKLLAVTWHTQAPLSYSKLAWRIRKLQSPLVVSPAHSYLPGKAAIGVLSLSHRHSPFLFLTRHVITISPWGFTSLYPGSSSHCCLPSTIVKPITINRASFNWKHIFDIFSLGSPTFWFNVWIRKFMGFFVSKEWVNWSFYKAVLLSAFLPKSKVYCQV